MEQIYRLKALLYQIIGENRFILDALNSMKHRDGILPSIELTYYSPNELHYHYSAATEHPVVFSEIYYPKGWHASVDGENLDLFRTDWILRGAILPAGEHDIVMRFDPQIFKFGERVSRASSAAMLVLLLLACAGMVVGRKKE